MGTTGPASITFDDVELTVRSRPPESATQLSASQLEGLGTLARLLGHIRFFHPSDASAHADWQSLTAYAVAQVLTSTSSVELKHVLETLTNALAPRAAIYHPGSRPPPNSDVAPGTPITRNVHVGYGDEDPFLSFRSGLEEPPTVGLRVTYHQRLAEIGTCKRAVVRISDSMVSGHPIIQLEVAPLGVAGKSRTTSTPLRQERDIVQAEIPADAYGVAFGLFIRGIGSIQISGIELACDGRTVATIRAGAEGMISGSARHLYNYSNGVPCGGARCIRIERRPEVSQSDRDVVDVELGPGLRLQMPVVVPLEAAHALPTQAQHRLVQLPASARASRIAAVLDLWTVLSWFYPYFTDQQIHWDATLRPALQAAAAAGSSDAQRRALARLAIALRDDHARVVRPGIDDGLLPLLFRSFGDRILVTAALAGFTSLPVGSTLVSVDGVPAHEARRRAGEMVSAATPAWSERQAAYGIAYGRKGTLASVTVREPQGAREVTRLVPRLDRSEISPKLREIRPASGTELVSRVFYIDLHTLDAATWDAVLPKLENARAIVFDLRGYIGSAAFLPLGYLADRQLRSPILLAPVVAPTGPQRYEEVIWHVSPRRPTLKAKAIFLVDARTASAPETIAQVVRGERLGTLVGEPTGGTNGNVVNYPTIGGMVVRFTALRVLNHDGSALQGHGITPDVIVHPTVEGAIAGRDEILDAAVRLAQAP